MREPAVVGYLSLGTMSGTLEGLWGGCGVLSVNHHTVALMASLS